ncbi:MAG TPA: TonB-dependent receptor, partial [Polyangiaceae bacterium]|nr:TonB-dependent receptor [Polyangiaceae bacterium]
VEVRGAPRAPHAPPKDPGVAGHVIRRERLMTPGMSAPEALRSAPGVQITESGGLGAPATASVRGATAAQTPVYFGSVRLNDEVAGAADLSSVPLWFVERVELYRGNAPLEADRLGIGGAVMFEPLRPKRSELAIGALAGSFGTRAAWLHSSAVTKRHALLVGVSAQAAENDYPFFDDRGTLFVEGDGGTARLRNADVSAYDLWLSSRSKVGSARIDVLSNHSLREQGVPKFALLPTYAARARFQRDFVALTARTPFEDACSYLELSTTALSGSSEFEDPLRELALAAIRVENRGERVEQNAALYLALPSGLVLRPALTAAVERLRRVDQKQLGDSELPSVVAHRISSRAALAAELPVLDALAIRGLGSVECHGTSTGSRSACDSVELSGRIGPSVRLGNVLLYANLARYTRTPTLGELYGMGVLVRGNDDLEPESGWTVDGGARFTSDASGPVRGYADLSGYLRSASNLVSFVRTAQGYLFPENRQSARVLGAELAAGASYEKLVDTELAVTLLDPRDTSPGRMLANDVLPFQSRLVASQALRFWIPTLYPVERPWIEVRYLYQSARYADPAGLARIPEQGSLDLELGAMALEEQLVARFRVRNLLATERFDVVGFPLPERTFYVSMEAKW